MGTVTSREAGTLLSSVGLEPRELWELWELWDLLRTGASGASRASGSSTQTIRFWTSTWCLFNHMCMHLILCVYEYNYIIYVCICICVHVSIYIYIYIYINITGANISMYVSMYSCFIIFFLVRYYV